ncbi:TadE family protein [Methylobacterium sp. SD21]|uniref:TadE/TadG family type IV pilus assembly protein n=1 Tax=Methylobacterium litchii TaxID=3138810 RepID=UPI00313D33B1
MATSLAVSEDGAAILEFVLVLPIMLALIGGAFELGRILLVDAALEAGVRGGARYLARVPDPFCTPGCSPGAAHAVGLARERILENTSLSPAQVRVAPLADPGPGHVGLRAEADVAVDLLGWVGLAPTIRISASHRESHVVE